MLKVWIIHAGEHSQYCMLHDRAHFDGKSLDYYDMMVVLFRDKVIQTFLAEYGRVLH